MGKGAIDENHVLSLGMLGMHGTAYANFAVSECDLLIAVGSRFDDRVTGKLDEFACHAQVIHIDIDPAEIGKNRVPQLALIGDVKKILREIIKEQNNEKVDKEQTRAWRDRITKWKQSYPLIVPNGVTQPTPQEVISLLAKLAPDAYYTTDVGQHQMWAAQFIKCGPRKWASSAGLGTMGFGVPAALGIQFAFPESLVICICGDSSFQMTLQELGTISQYNLPIKIIIVNNKWQGMVRQWQQSFYGERYSHSEMTDGMPDFSQLALAYGIKGVSINTCDDLEENISKILSEPGPVVADIQVIRDENCYPMVAPGKSNSQMMGIFKKSSKLAKV